MTNDMEPRELVKKWVLAFNCADVDEVAAFYAQDAVRPLLAVKRLGGG